MRLQVLCRIVGEITTVYCVGLLVRLQVPLLVRLQVVGEITCTV